MTGTTGFQRETFCSDYGPNYHPTFEVFLITIPEKITVRLKDQEGQEVWKRDVYLTSKGFTLLQQHC